MEISQLLLAIEKTSPAPIKSNVPLKLSYSLRSLSNDELEAAIVSAIKKEVESRGNDFQLPQGSEMSTKIPGVISWLLGPQRRSCLQLQGCPGTGKTTLMNALYDFLRAGEMSVTKTTSQNLYDCFIMQASGASSAFHEYKVQPRLFIDDFGTEPSKCLIWGVEYMPLQTLFDYRYSRQLPTVITTNLSDAMIRERYGERLSDRFAEMCTILRFSGQSYRK